MSKRSERHEAERLARRKAYLANLQSAATASSPENEPEISESSEPETTESSPIEEIRRPDLRCNVRTIPGEDEDAYRWLYGQIYSKYTPENEVERLLVQAVIEHQWRVQRAIRLQDHLLTEPELDAQRLSLFMRYQAIHERSYYKALKELQNIQKEKRKNEIGFESQKRQNEALEAKTRLAHAKAQTLEVEAHCRQVMEAPIPGTHNIPFETLTKACSEAIAALVFRERHQVATE